MANEFTTDVTKWQGVDDVPTAGSDNLVKSGGVALLNALRLSIDGTITQDNPTGAGTSKNFKVVPNKPFTVIFDNPDWDRSNYTGSSYILTIGYNDSQGFHDVIAKLRNQTIDTQYTITPQSENAYVFVRANDREEVNFSVYDSELVATLPELNQKIEDEKTELNGKIEEVNEKTFLNYHCFLATGGALTKIFNNNLTLSLKFVGKLVITVESLYTKVYDFGTEGQTFTIPLNGSLGYNRTTDTWEVHGDGYQGYNNTNICMLHYNAQTKTYGGVLATLLMELGKIEFDELNCINGNIAGTITQENPTGAGVTFNFKAIPNKPCNVIINNPNWDRSNYTGSSYILTIGYRDSQGVAHDVIGKIGAGATIDTLYTFTPLTENAYVFARANAGVNVSFKVVESELIATLPELKTSIETNSTEIAEIKENVNIYDGTAPYLGEKININTLKYVLSVYKFNQVNSYFQGFTRNKDYAIAIENGSYIHIHSAIDDSELGAYQLPVQYHASCCFFSNEKYNEADPMPILFVTGTYDGAQTNITGFRIGFESATQVQNITFTKQSEDSGYIVDVVGFDRDTNKVYVVALSSLNFQSLNNNYIFYQYDMPALSQGSEVSLSEPNLIGSIPFPNFFEFTQDEYANPQAITAYNGQLFLHVGRSSVNSNLLFIVDIATGVLKNMIRYGRDIRQEEAEGNVVFDGKYYNMAVTTGRVTSVVFE